MKRTVSLILTIILIFSLASGCGKKEAENPMAEVKVTLPASTGTRAVAEGEAVLATEGYLLARAYIEKLESYNLDAFNAQEYSALLSQAAEAVRIAEGLCASLENHAGILAEAEENGAAAGQEKAVYEVLSASGGGRTSPFIAYAAEEKSAAVRYAEELTKAYDNAKNGRKLKTVAEKYGTDVKKAKLMLEQAQAILEGAAYEEQADFENKCYEAAVETKAAASAIGFGVAVAAAGGIAAGGASAAGIIEAGGLAFSGVSAVIDMGTAVTIHATNGEGNEYTTAWEKTGEIFAPVSTVFAIGGGIGNIKDFRNPEKAAEAVNNAAQAFLVGLGLARDYVQDGTVLGVSANVIDGCREIIIRSADPSSPEEAKKVLLETGVDEKPLEAAETDEAASAQQTQDGRLGALADTLTEDMGALTSPDNPLDMDAVLENISEAFLFLAQDEGIEIESIPEPDEPDEPDDEAVSDEPVEPDENPGGGGVLPAEKVAGRYYFPELEDSADIDIAVSDSAHLTMTDVANGESFVGDYDETTGVLYVVLSDRFGWYVTIKFSDTRNGIQAEFEETLGAATATSTAVKK